MRGFIFFSSTGIDMHRRCPRRCVTIRVVASLGLTATKRAASKYRAVYFATRLHPLGRFTFPSDDSVSVHFWPRFVPRRARSAKPAGTDMRPAEPSPRTWFQGVVFHGEPDTRKHSNGSEPNDLRSPAALNYSRRGTFGTYKADDYVRLVALTWDCLEVPCSPNSIRANRNSTLVTAVTDFYSRRGLHHGIADVALPLENVTMPTPL